jgi:hypothetical protein
LLRWIRTDEQDNRLGRGVSHHIVHKQICFLDDEAAHVLSLGFYKLTLVLIKAEGISKVNYHEGFLG